jgi:hypothetical protein
MLLLLADELVHACLAHVDQFKDLCCIVSVSKDMHRIAGQTRHSFVQQLQLQLQCGGCLNSYRAPGLTRYKLPETTRSKPPLKWTCPGCLDINEVSRTYHSVVRRPGFDCHMWTYASRTRPPTIDKVPMATTFRLVPIVKQLLTP